MASVIPAADKTQTRKVSSLQSKAGTKALADDKNKDSKDTKGKHDCAGKNDCKGQGGCKSGDNGCKGKNSCKGKGGCSTNSTEKDKKEDKK
jgi:hypothetical protein